MSRGTLLGCLVVATVLAVVHGVFVHRPLGVTPDSVAYLTAARSLMEHGALVTIDLRTGHLVPLVHFPPLYPMALAVGGTLLDTPERAASVLQFLVLVLNLTLIAWLVAWAQPRRRMWVFAPVFCFAFPGFLLVHAMVWSEPLFILLSLTSLVFLARGLRGDDSRDLFLSAALASLAFLTRYLGLAVVLGGATACFLYAAESPPRRRLFRSVRYLAVASFLPLLWLGRTALVGEAPAGRSLVVHFPRPPDLLTFLDTMLGWVVPGTAPLAVRSAVALSVVAAAAWVLWRARTSLSTASRATVATMSLYLAAFLLVVVVSRSALDAMVPLGERMLSPLVPVFVVLLVMAAHAAAGRSRAMRGGVIALLLVLFLGQGVRGAWWLGSEGGRGKGYVSERWRESEAIDFVRRLPPDTPVFSNQSDVIFHLAARVNASIPWAFGYEGEVGEADVASRLAAWAEEAAERDALVVYFDDGRDEIPPLERVEAACRPRLLARLADAVVFRCAGRQSARSP